MFRSRLFSFSLLALLTGLVTACGMTGKEWTQSEFVAAAVGKTRAQVRDALGVPDGTRTDPMGNEHWFYRLRVRYKVQKQGVISDAVGNPTLIFFRGQTKSMLGGFFIPERMDKLLGGSTSATGRTGAASDDVQNSPENLRAFAAGRTYDEIAAAWGSPKQGGVSADGSGNATWERSGLTINVAFERRHAVAVVTFPSSF